MNHHYDRHSHTARAIAEEYFDAGRVLSSLIERALNSEHSSEAASTLDPASGAIEC